MLPIRRASIAPLVSLARASLARPIPSYNALHYTCIAARLNSTSARPVAPSKQELTTPQQKTTVTQPAKSLSGKYLLIDISKTAAAKLRALMAEESNPELALRIHVESGGCHGFQYVFRLQKRSDVTNKDSIFERDGACVLIDHSSLQILRDSTIDYTTELIGSQFKIKSPHTSSSCGCGSSFAIEPEKS